MTAVEKVLNKTRAAADQRTAAAREKYAEYVRLAGSGADLDPDELAEFLDAHGFDVLDFQTAAESYSRRLDLKAKVDGRPAAERRREQAEAKIGSLVAKFDERERQLAEERYATISPIEQQRDAAARAVAEADDAAAELHRTAPRELIDQRDAAQRGLADAQRAIDKLEADLARIRAIDLPKAEAAVAGALHCQSRPQFATPQQGGNAGLAEYEKEDSRRAVERSRAYLDQTKAAIQEIESKQLPALRSDLARQQADLAAANLAIMTP